MMILYGSQNFGYETPLSDKDWLQKYRVKDGFYISESYIKQELDRLESAVQTATKDS